MEPARQRAGWREPRRRILVKRPQEPMLSRTQGHGVSATHSWDGGIWEADHQEKTRQTLRSTGNHNLGSRGLSSSFLMFDNYFLPTPGPASKCRNSGARQWNWFSVGHALSSPAPGRGDLRLLEVPPLPASCKSPTTFWAAGAIWVTFIWTRTSSPELQRVPPGRTGEPQGPTCFGDSRPAEDSCSTGIRQRTEIFFDAVMALWGWHKPPKGRLGFMEGVWIGSRLWSLNVEPLEIKRMEGTSEAICSWLRGMLNVVEERA